MAREFILLSVLWIVVVCLAATTTADVNTTTTPPDVNTTTIQPGVNTTTIQPGVNTTMTTPPDGNTTLPEANTTVTRPAGPTTLPSVAPTTPDPCDGKPCGDESTCEPRVNQNFTCLCLAGEYNYETKICEKAKVFPGQLQLPSLTFTEAMTVKTSPEFFEASLKITEELQSVFEGSTDYSGSIVLELHKLPSTDSKFWSRSAGGVGATVELFFKANAAITSAEVSEKIENGTKCVDCLLENGSFNGTTLCDKEPCDSKTTTCGKRDGSFSCNCVENYIYTDFSTLMCIACPSGSKANSTYNCVSCPFGYSGFNCNENWKLVLVIVGSVLGALLLIAVSLLPILACRPSKKSSKKSEKSHTEKPYDSRPHAKAPMVNSGVANSQAASDNRPANNLSAFVNAGVPRIPRATSTNSWNSRTNLEMTQSNSRQNLIPVGRNPRPYDDHEDMNPYAQPRPQSSLYSQARPQNNPYSQNRPQANPYAQSQGKSNPYYVEFN